MEINNILQPEAVKVIGKITSKKRLFQTLADAAADLYGMSSVETLNALQDRESLGPTGVGHGVALPHARIDGLQNIVGLFLKLESPLNFDSVDRQPVDLICTLFAPADSGVDHLKALALVSRTLRDQSVCAKLRANSDPATLHAILAEIRPVQAA